MSSASSNFIINVTTVFLFAITAILVYLKWSLNYWQRKNVPVPSVAFPFGNAKQTILQKETFGADLKSAYLDMREKGAKYCGYYFFTRPILLLMDLELIKTIMTKDFVHFTDHVGYVNEEVDPLSGHLFALKGLKWKNLRTKLTPTFTSGKMKMMFQTLVESSDQLIELLDEYADKRQEIDIKDVVGRFTTDIIGSCAFGIECNSLKNPNAEFRRYGRKVFELNALDFFKNLLALVSPKFLDIFKIPITKSDVSNFFLKAVEDTVKYRENNNVVRKDFMHLLIQLKNNIKVNDQDNVGQLKNSEDEVGTTLTVGELAAQAFVFFLAGFETSSTTLTFCFSELVRNLEIQEKLRQEINEILERHGGKINYNALMEMSYMDKCINETLRKYPPIPLLTRECTQTYTLPGTDLVLSKGMQIFIPIMGIQHDPEYYPEPEKFDPERFSPENKSARHPYTWLPFGEGPRGCIGLRFGIMQTKVALAVLLKNYKFTLNPRTKSSFDLDPRSFVLSVKDGVYLNAQKIKS